MLNCPNLETTTIPNVQKEDELYCCLLNILALAVSGPHCPVVVIPVEEITSPAILEPSSTSLLVGLWLKYTFKLSCVSS